MRPPFFVIPGLTRDPFPGEGRVVRRTNRPGLLAIDAGNLRCDNDDPLLFSPRGFRKRHTDPGP